MNPISSSAAGSSQINHTSTSSAPQNISQREEQTSQIAIDQLTNLSEDNSSLITDETSSSNSNKRKRSYSLEIQFDDVDISNENSSDNEEALRTPDRPRSHMEKPRTLKRRKTGGRLQRPVNNRIMRDLFGIQNLAIAVNLAQAQMAQPVQQPIVAVQLVPPAQSASMNALSQ